MVKLAMNIRDLEYFVQVAEHKHFGKAAAAAFVSQPTLSMQLKKLETELSVSLFDRQDKKIRITEAGLLLLPKAKEIIASAKAIKASAKTLQNPFAMPFRLGVIPTIAPYFLPHILPALQAALPQLKLILIEEKTQILLEQLEENQIDAALLALPIHHHVSEAILLTEPFVVALPKNHPLAKHHSLSPAMLAHENLLMLEEGHCLREHALQFCNNLDPQKETYRATSLETLCQMVALGHGITLLPEYAAANRPQLEIRPFTTGKSTPSRKIGLLWKANSPRLKAIQMLKQSVENILKIR